MLIASLNEVGVFLDEAAQAEGLADEGEGARDSFAHIILAEGGRCFFVPSGIAFHVKFAERLQLCNLILQLRDAIDLLLLLRIGIEGPGADLLVKVLVLVHLFAKVPHGLSLGVEEKIVDLAEVELKRALLPLAFARLCRCCWLSHLLRQLYYNCALVSSGVFFQTLFNS